MYCRIYTLNIKKTLQEEIDMKCNIKRNYNSEFLDLHFDKYNYLKHFMLFDAERYHKCQNCRFVITKLYSKKKKLASPGKKNP